MRYNLKQIKALSKLFMDLSTGMLLAGMTLPSAFSTVGVAQSIKLLFMGGLLTYMSLALKVNQRKL